MTDLETRSCLLADLRVDTRGLGRIIRGYAVVFGELSQNLGGFREKIAPSAVDRTLTEGIDLVALIGHDPDRPLGRLSAGTLRVDKDERGLRVEIDPPPSPDGENITVSIQRRDVTGMSFAFQHVAEGVTWDLSVDPPIQTVRDMRIREVSVVTFPAYPQTAASVRSLAAAWAAVGPPGVPRTVTERLTWSAEKFRGPAAPRRR